MELEVIKISEDKKKIKPKDETQLGFGNYFSDHFFNMLYDNVNGWHSARIEPYRNLEMDPASLTFHYGQEIFEGMKSYYGIDGGIYLFRPRDYFNRMNRSAKRLCMPQIDADFVIKALKELILVDKEWIPRSIGTALYIRPVMIATQPSVGVKVSSRYAFYIITGPVGAFYAKGFEPIRISVCDEYARAVKGGTGFAKTGGNYAASLYATEEAKREGFDQVLWLDALERKYVEEVGTMNIFFKFKDRIITPPLTGTIMPGITRDSVIRIIRNWDIPIDEKRISIDEVIDGIKTGDITEVFGTGTAVVISPVGELNYKGRSYIIGNGKAGDFSKRVFNEIIGLQYGSRVDAYGWRERVDI
jgi:branched-chain amino acid aminotransferase